MKRYAIPLAGVLCLALWACAQTVPPPSPPPMVISNVTSVPCPASPAWPAGGDLLTHVQYVQLNVPVTVQPNTDFSITPDPTPIDPAIQRDLAAAFTANPGFSTNELCPLDGIFINWQDCSSRDPSTCSAMQDKDVADNSWGLRTPLPSSKKYIAISLGLWRCPPGSPQNFCAPPFTQYHQRLVKALLDKTAGMPVSVNPIFKTPSGTNTPGLGILSALAHERGHIYWFETFVQTSGGPITTTAFCTPPFYPGGRWEGVSVDLPNNRYVQFAHLSLNSPVNNLPGSFPGGGAAAVVDGLYRGGRFPSLLGAYSSDEDFVEAFEWSVLRNARVSSVPLSDVSVNVIGTVGADRPILTRGHGNANGAEQKLQCFDALSQSGPR
jgi:hypothetical protein